MTSLASRGRSQTVGSPHRERTSILGDAIGKPDLAYLESSYGITDRAL